MCEYSMSTQNECLNFINSLIRKHLHFCAQIFKTEMHCDKGAISITGELLNQFHRFIICIVQFKIIFGQ